MKKQEININVNDPMYNSRSEVFKAAYENMQFFDTFSEALKLSWKFYK